MHARFPKHPLCRWLHQVGPARATLLALLMVVVAFAPPLTPQAEASSNPGVTISPGFLEVEEGGTNQYTVVLDSEPASNATVAIDSYNLGGRNGVTYNPSSLVFTRDNWDTPQSITVTALQDDDDHSLLFGLSHWVTVDERIFRVGAGVTVKVNDDDQEEVKLSTTALTLFEGESRDYTVWLNRQPQNDVTVDPWGTGSNFVFEPSELTFTPDNWAIPQTITITAEYDEDWVNDTATIRHAGGANYGHNRSTKMAVTVIDILEPGVRVYPRTLALDAGGTASYGISMWSTDCTDDTVVTVRIRSNNPSVSVNKSQVTFTKASCFEEMPVIVSAASGAGDITATLTHTVTGHSNVTSAPPLPVTVTGDGTTTTPVTTTTTTPVTTTTTPVTTTTTTPVTTTTTPVTTTTTPVTTTTTPVTTTTTPVTTTTTPVTSTVPTTDTDSDTETNTDTDTESESGDGNDPQSGENRIDCDDLETQTPFVDVLESSPEAQAIACIYALGLTTGTTPTTYSPGANVNRAQMASFLARLYKATTGTEAPLTDTPFTDVATTSSAYNDIGRIYGLGITTGTTPTTYSPAANVNRAQMASFLARLYKATTGTEAPLTDTPFTDVATTSSAYNDIGRIYGLGITTGTTPTTYSPATNVNRAQMASFLAGLHEATTETQKPLKPTNRSGPLVPWTH